mgnify:CR=1 FL=1
MDSFFCNSIGKNKELNTMLMHECDIYFYEQLQDVQFSENQETYSMPVSYTHLTLPTSDLV